MRSAPACRQAGRAGNRGLGSGPSRTLRGPCRSRASAPPCDGCAPPRDVVRGRRRRQSCRADLWRWSLLSPGVSPACHLASHAQHAEVQPHCLHCLPTLSGRLVLGGQLLEEQPQAGIVGRRPGILAIEVQLVAKPFAVVPPLRNRHLGGGHGDLETAARLLGNLQHAPTSPSSAYHPIRGDMRKSAREIWTCQQLFPVVPLALDPDHPNWDDIRVCRITCSPIMTRRQADGEYQNTVRAGSSMAR